MRFNGKVALVTGGASGIGLAVARRLVREGARLILWDINPSALMNVANLLGDGALCQVVDVADESQVVEALSLATAKLGRLDILVNSAGIVGPTGPFWKCSLSEWERVIGLNLSAVFTVSKAAVGYLDDCRGVKIRNPDSELLEKSSGNVLQSKALVIERELAG